MSTLQAKEIYFQPSLNIHTEYDDNKRLRAATLSAFDDSSYGVIARATALFGVRDDWFNATLQNQAILNRYASDLDLDSEDFNVKFASTFNLTEKHTFNFSGNYVRNTTLTSELDSNGTGLVQDNIVREQWSVAPAWSYLLSNSQLLQFDYRHSSVMYEESNQAQLFDFSSDLMTLTYNHQWTELFQSYLSVSAMFFDVPEVGRETTEYSVNLGLNYQFLPTWSTSLALGRRFTNTFISIAGFSSSDDVEGMIFSFSVKKEFETGDLSLSFNRSTSAQGNGQLRSQDNLSANYNYDISETLRFFLVGGLYVDSLSGSQNAGDDRTYYHVNPSIRWQIDRNISMSAGYRFRMQEFERNDDTAVSNSVFLNFNYQWDKISTQKY